MTQINKVYAVLYQIDQWKRDELQNESAYRKFFKLEELHETSENENTLLQVLNNIWRS